MTESERTRWHRVNSATFLGEIVMTGTVQLIGSPRPDVATRQWWTLTWTTDSYVDTKVHQVQASSLRLLFERAAVVAQREEEIDADT